MKKNNIILVLIFAFILTGCESDLVTILDEYNPPYSIKAVPTNDAIIISFISGVLASDFAGFNIYISPTLTSFQQTNDALTNSQGFLPTIFQNNHVRELFEITIPGTYPNGTLYNIAVTAYGTNSLAENSFIETKIDAVLPVIPRPEGSIPITGNVAINIPGAGIVANRVGNTIIPAAPYKIQYFSTQSNFNDIIIITNNDFATDFDTIPMPTSLNGLYILYNNTSLVKLWITEIAGNDITFRWAVQNQATRWNGV